MIKFYVDSEGGILGLEYHFGQWRWAFAKRLIDFPPAFLNDRLTSELCNERPAHGDYDKKCYKELAEALFDELNEELNKGKVSLLLREQRKDYPFQTVFQEGPDHRDRQPKVRMIPGHGKVGPKAVRAGRRISSSTGPLGSLGTIVEKKGLPGKPHILSCWHVLAHRGSLVGNRIAHTRLGHIGNLAERIIPPGEWLKKGDTDDKCPLVNIDAAIAEVTAEYKDRVQDNYLAEIGQVKANQILHMFGGKSRLRVGKVTALCAYVFNYGSPDPFCMPGFKIEICSAVEELSRPGDSGSIWYEDCLDDEEFVRHGIGLHVNGGELLDLEDHDPAKFTRKRKRRKGSLEKDPWKKFAFASRLEDVYRQLELCKPKGINKSQVQKPVTKGQCFCVAGACPRCGQVIKLEGEKCEEDKADTKKSTRDNPSGQLSAALNPPKH